MYNYTNTLIRHLKKTSWFNSTKSKKWKHPTHGQALGARAASGARQSSGALKDPHSESFILWVLINNNGTLAVSRVGTYSFTRLSSWTRGPLRSLRKKIPIKYYRMITTQKHPVVSPNAHSNFSPFLLALQEALLVLVYPCPPNQTRTPMLALGFSSLTLFTR